MKIFSLAFFITILTGCETYKSGMKNLVTVNNNDGRPIQVSMAGFSGDAEIYKIPYQFFGMTQYFWGVKANLMFEEDAAFKSGQLVLKSGLKFLEAGDAHLYVNEYKKYAGEEDVGQVVGEALVAVTVGGVAGAAGGQSPSGVFEKDTKTGPKNEGKRGPYWNAKLGKGAKIEVYAVFPFDSTMSDAVLSMK
jgi:hypothetical protein